MKISLTEEQVERIQSKLVYEKVLDEMVFKINLITEDGKTEPDMEWDFTDVKKDIDKSSKWVKTKEDLIEYITTLKEKIKNLSSEVKKRIVKYIIISFIGLVSINQMQKYFEKPIVKAVETEKEVLKKVLSQSQSNKEKDFKIRNSSLNLKNHLKKEENLSLTAYNIGDGAFTIGYGHAIFPKEKENYDFLPRYNKIVAHKTKITEKEAEQLLNDDIKEAEKTINQILDKWEDEGIKPKITQGMYDAMVSMAFNMGPGIKKTEFIKAIKDGDLQMAKKLILSTSERMFDDYPGLKKRRENEHNMFV